VKFRVGTNRKNKILDFNSLLPDVITDLNISDEFVIGNIRSAWKEIAGNILSAHSMPDRIFKGYLFIISDHPAYSNDIMMMKDQILKKVEEMFPYSAVKNIKVEIKNIKWNS
jgi:hypothetical protein